MKRIFSSIILIQFLLTFLTACAIVVVHTIEPPIYNYQLVDKRALTYVHRFEKNSGFKIPYVRIKFVKRFERDKGRKDGKMTVGLCVYRSRQIYILESWWNKESDLRKEELINHEIGHCILNKDHDERMIEGSECPWSLMYPNTLSEECYRQYHEHYLRELLDFSESK